MAYQRDQSDLNRTQELRTQELRSQELRNQELRNEELRNGELRRRQALDNELQADPELAEGPASGGRMALFAVAVIAILGVVFYGLNNSPTNTAQTPPATISTPAQQNAQGNTMSPATPNANPGQTTGAAPSAPQSGTSSSEPNNSAGTMTNDPASPQTGNSESSK